MADFAFLALKMMSDAGGGPGGRGRPEPDPGFRRVLEQVGIAPGDFVRGLIEAREAGAFEAQPAGTIHAFKDLMLPALVRVGAVTERSRARFAEAGIPVYEDTSVLASMEDQETGDLSGAPEAA